MECRGKKSKKSLFKTINNNQFKILNRKDILTFDNLSIAASISFNCFIMFAN